MPPFAAGQTKIRCKLGIQRIRTVVDKGEGLAKRSRREVATLLEGGKVETARIRTESLILQDGHNEL
jgi:vacuolar protein sorting-associated protein IST1